MIYEVSRDGETSSSCSECKKENENLGLDESSQEVLIEGISQQLSSHQHQQHQLIRGLQEQNRRLKLINEDHEREMRSLRYQVQMSRIKSFAPSELIKSHRDLPKFQTLPGQISPKKVGRLLSPQLKTKTTTKDRLERAEPMLHVVILEKQIKELQLKILQMNQKIHDYEENQSWMLKFIHSFTSMAQELSTNYRGNLKIKGLTMRKKTKQCWKYMKELINYLIKA